MINKEGSTPVYLQAAQMIRKEIKTRGMKAGDMLPSDRELCEIYGISHMTVKNAVNVLVSEGLLIRKRGKGTFVAEAKHVQSLFSLAGFTGENRAAGKNPHSTVLKFELVKPDAEIAQKLMMDKKEKAVNLKRVRLLDDEPVLIENVYLHLPEDTHKAFMKHHFENESLYHVLKHDFSIDLLSAEQTIELSTVSKEDYEALCSAEGKPMFFLKRTSYDQDNHPIEYIESIYRADKYIFSAKLIAQEGTNHDQNH